MANIIKTPNTPKRTKASKAKIATIITITLLVLGVLALAYLLASGRLAIVMKDPAEKLGSTRAIVCDSAMVDKYNTASFLQVRQGEEAPSMDIDGLKKLSENIKQQNLYEADPTCQAILFWTAVITKDVATAERSHAELVKLHDDQQFVDNNLSGDQSLKNYNAQLDILKMPTGEGDGAEL